MADEQESAVAEEISKALDIGVDEVKRDYNFVFHYLMCLCTYYILKFLCLMMKLFVYITIFLSGCVKKKQNKKIHLFFSKQKIHLQHKGVTF